MRGAIARFVRLVQMHKYGAELDYQSTLPLFSLYLQLVSLYIFASRRLMNLTSSGEAMRCACFSTSITHFSWLSISAPLQAEPFHILIVSPARAFRIATA